MVVVVVVVVVFSRWKNTVFPWQAFYPSRSTAIEKRPELDSCRSYARQHSTSDAKVVEIRQHRRRCGKTQFMMVRTASFLVKNGVVYYCVCHFNTVLCRNFWPPAVCLCWGLGELSAMAPSTWDWHAPSSELLNGGLVGSNRILTYPVLPCIVMFYHVLQLLQPWPCIRIS